MKHVPSARHVRGLVLLAAVSCASSAYALNGVGDGRGGIPTDGHWVGTWSAAPQSQDTVLGTTPPPPVVSNETLRQIVHASIGGESVRVRFSNVFGVDALVIDTATIALADEASGVLPASLRSLTFGGLVSASIPAGEQLWSDPVALQVDDEADLAVSVYVASETPVTTLHVAAHQTAFFSTAGDFTTATALPVARTMTSLYWLTGVDVWADRETQTVVTIGDSITEGSGSTVDGNARYPDVMARRLLKRFRGTRRVSVLNQGIGGNRLLTDFFGPHALVRLDRDVLEQSGATHVVLLEGVNDLGLGNTPLGPVVGAAEIIAGMEQIIARVHDAGLKVLVGTMTPFKGFENFVANYWTPQNEIERETINTWIRTSDLHDGVIDFAKAIRDRGDHETMRSVYDAGDHLHPGDPGYEKMGKKAARVVRRSIRRGRREGTARRVTN